MTAELRPVNSLLGDVDANVFDSNVVVIPVSLAALGIDPAAASARISYWVAVLGYYGTAADGVNDFSVKQSFDPLKPGVWLEGQGGREVTQPAGSLRNTDAAGAADITFTFGDPRGFPVAGDFDGDGLDDVAVARNGNWLIRTAWDGKVYGPFVLGAGAWPSVVPVVGDWDGDGIDGIGYYCRDGAVCPAGTWKLLQTIWDDPASANTFVYNPGPLAYPVAGDWDADGKDTVGVKSMTTPGTWRLNNQNDGSAAEITFDFGAANDLPVVWARPPVAP